MEFKVPTTLETDRLILRQFQEPDWHALHAYYGDELATTFTMGRALSQGESWRAMSSMVGHWYLRGYGPYAMVEKETNQLIGITGLWYPNDWPEPEIKWALVPDYTGQGFASEGARAIQKMVKQRLSETPLISFIHSDNQPSRQLAEAIGCHLEKEVPFRGSVWCIYRHPQ